MFEALEGRCDLQVLHTGDLGDSWLDRAAARAIGSLARRSYLTGHALATSRRHGRYVTKALRHQRPDVVLAVAASQDVAHAQSDAPIVQITDATFAAIEGFYPLFENLHPAARRQGHAMAAKAQQRTTGFGVASEWARNSLVQHYAADPADCRVIPFGPGVEPPSPVRPAVHNGPLRILVVASDWHRKGGVLALEAVERLRREGTAAALTVVGDAPTLPSWVCALGRLPRSEMASVYAGHDVLLEMASANAGGVTMTDAHAFGLPVVATKTGGTASIVDDGVTGLLVDDSASAVQAAAALRALSDRTVRTGFSARALRRHEELLNWDRWARDVLALCADAIGRHRG
jgi:glycosyltransferase involved in cell wall biosynthesis